MAHIVHDNIFEYLSVDMDMDEDDLRMKLTDLGTQSFMQYLKDKEVSMFTTTTVLSTELRDMMGSVLINKGIPLDKYVDTLLDRYVLDDYFTTSAFAIQSSDEIMRIYRKKAITKVNAELQKTVTAQEKYKRFYNKVNSGEIKAQDQFDGFMNSLLSNTDGIAYMLKMIKNLDFHKETFTQTTNSTFICIAIALMHAKKSKSLDINSFLQKVTCTSFFQNAGVFSGLAKAEAHPSEKCKKSAMIVAKLCKDDSVTEAIKDRLRFKNDDGDPIFERSNSNTNFYKNLLMTTNLFMDIIKKNRFAPESLEVHKAMYELAKQGYADPKIVSMIGELFLPRLKHQLLEFAFKIQDDCKERPIIWGVAGDMLPIKFICKKDQCQHCGLHKTLIPQDVEIVADEIYETKTKAGIYYTCELLTNKLQVQYKAIQKQMN